MVDSLAVPVWILAVCALIWTVRMLLRVLLAWLDDVVEYGFDTPWYIRTLSALTGGGRW